MKKILQGTEVPNDFHYFRATSPAYRKYLEEGGLKTIPVGKQYGWMKDFKLFQIVKFERTDEPPTKEILVKAGFKRGLVLWVPAHKDSIKLPWRELWIPGSHFMSTGIGRARSCYFNAWNERAKRARKKFLSYPNIGVRSVSMEQFEGAFSKTRVRHSFRRDYITYYKKMYAADPDCMRSYLVYEDENPIAGLAVHDYDKTSTHLTAFTSATAKKYQAGTGLIDRWYSDSIEKDITYIHFDHLRDAHMTRDQQGYTDFKLNFIEETVLYPKIYFQFLAYESA